MDMERFIPITCIKEIPIWPKFKYCRHLTLQSSYLIQSTNIQFLIIIYLSEYDLSMIRVE